MKFISKFGWCLVVIKGLVASQHTSLKWTNIDHRVAPEAPPYFSDCICIIGDESKRIFAKGATSGK